MAIPLWTVLSAAPGVIASVTDIVKAVRALRAGSGKDREKTVQEIEALIEKQAVAMRELAESNRQLALAARNNRIVSIVSLLLAIVAMVIAMNP